MKQAVKTVLHSVGLFPIARSAYRKFAMRGQTDKEARFYRDVLPPTPRCFDIGANLGQRTEVFLRCGASQVVAVEPNAHCRPTLNHLFQSNPRVIILPVAVGDVSGEIDLYAASSESTASVRQDWDGIFYKRDKPLPSQKVRVVTLQTIIERYGVPDFVKIDVEGFEYNVILGLKSRLPLLSLEYHAAEIDRLKDCIGLLSKLGHLSFRLSDIDCNWLGERIASEDEVYRMIETSNVDGDIFIWTD